MRTETEEIPFSKDGIIIVPGEKLHGSKSNDFFENISIYGDFSILPHFDRIVSFRENECTISLGKLIYENRFRDSLLLSSMINSYPSRTIFPTYILWKKHSKK